MDPTALATAASMMIQGATQTAAASAIGVPQQTLSSALSPDIRERIRQAQITLINTSLDKAVQNQALKINIANSDLGKYQSGGTLRPGAKTILELADKAEDRLLQSVGIHPSHTQSAQYLNLTQITMEISPEVSKLLGLEAVGIEDVEMEEVEDQ